MKRLMGCVVMMAAITIPVSADAAKELKQPNTYAVVIGISQYREEVVPKIAYAVKDAEAVARMLETQGGIPRTNIKLLTDTKATVGDFRNYFGEWLRMRVKADSTVYVYFAGHGTPNPSTGEAYLVPWEGHPDFPAGLYPLKELYESLNKLPAKDVVVLLDSCFSGATGRSVLAKGARPMVVSVENPLLAAGKVVVLAAASGNQISSDYEKAGHGLFTHYLLTGLQGEADTDKDGIVTLNEVVPYVREHVARTAVDELNREQTPTLLPGEEALKTRIAIPMTLATDLISTLSQAEEELKALDEQERQIREQKKLAAVQKAIEEKKRKVTEEKSRPIEEARVRPPEAPKDLTRETIGKDGVPMVLVPEGEFLYGDDNERLWLPTFYIDKYEVTTKNYAKFLQATDRDRPQDWSEVSLVNHGDRPVVGVTWHDAEAYCRWVGRRLPTETEWEKAARGTDGRKYPWGNDEPQESLANYGKAQTVNAYSSGLASVGSYDAGKSPYGVYDLAGNVWEWTASSSRGFRIVRGGSWLNVADSLQATNRNEIFTSSKYNNLGFRCAQDAK